MAYLNSDKAGSVLTDFLREHNLEELGRVFAQEELSLSQLRQMANDSEEAFIASMSELNIEYNKRGRICTALRGGTSGATSAAPALTLAVSDEVRSAQATLAAMAKQQAAQQAAPGGASSVLKSDLLAAALGNVASTTAPRLPAAELPKKSEPVPSNHSKLSYDSWKAGKAEPAPENPSTSALKSYQERLALDMGKDGALGSSGASDLTAAKGALVVADEKAQRAQRGQAYDRPMGMWGT
jgi:hypothetical protein